MDRLKNSRSRLLDKYRQTGEPEGRDGGLRGSQFLVQEVMEEEWNALQLSNRGLPSLWNKDGIGEVSSLAPVGVCPANNITAQPDQLNCDTSDTSVGTVQ